jgi:GNAT superfamily N-acetyltransferase
MKPLIKVHDMEASDEYFVGTCTHTHESEELDLSAARRLEWLRAMHKNGSRVKVATIAGKLAGFLHVIPIEFCPWGPLGRDLLVIPCLVSISKGQGVGKVLLDAAEEEAKQQRRKAIVTIAYRHDFWYMPASFFDANGFSECENPQWKSRRSEDTRALLWKVIDESAQVPTLLKPNYKFKPIRGRVVIDLFWNDFCQTSNIEAQRVREVAAEFGDSVALNEYSADNRPVFLHHQIARGIYVNGLEIGWGHEAPSGGIREAIARALRK